VLRSRSQKEPHHLTDSELVGAASLWCSRSWKEPELFKEPELEGAASFKGAPRPERDVAPTLPKAPATRAPTLMYW
jgi:hypothetical protein